jgi:hypothetical protein
MVKRNSNNGNKRQPARQRGKPITQVNRPLSSSVYHFQSWVTAETKAHIAKDQNVYTVRLNVNPKNFPELQDYMTRYQNVVVNSLGARFITGMKNISGTHACYVLGSADYDVASIPTTTNHMWLRRNGCKTKQTEQNVVSPPNVNRAKHPRTATPSISATATGTSLGYVYWIFEGPSDSSDRTHLGEIEVYLDAIFSGL